MRFTIILITITFMLAICLGLSAKAENVFDSADYQKLLEEANTFYSQNKYYEAIKDYNKIIQSGINNCNIYYNLANAYFKNDQLGMAILNYENALVYEPRNSNVIANLNFALNQTPDQISSEESIEPILKILFFWYYNFNFVELIYLTLFINFVFCLCAIYHLIYYNDYAKLAAQILVIILAVLLVSCGVKFLNNNNPEKGVIVVNESDIKSANGFEYETLFKLHEGTVFNVLDEKGDWYKIGLSNGQKGWIHKDSIGLVDAKM